MLFWDFKRSAASVELLVAYGRQKGLSTTALLRGSGISRAQLTDPNVELAAVRELRVIANFLRLAGAPHLGLDFGQRYRFTTYGLWGYGLISSATVGEALDMALRYLPLSFLFTQVHYRHDRELATLSFDEPDFSDELRQFVVERDMAAAAALIRDLAGDDFALTRLRLRSPDAVHRPRPAPLRVFGAEPVFGAPRNEIAVDAALLARPLPGANPITAAMCEQLCAELVRRRTAQSSTSHVVSQYLAVPGIRLPDLAQMARHLNTSERTLKRRLQAEGTSFRLLLESRRRGLALELLRERELSLSAIAERLGYADLSSFSQAHKRWHGVSPRTLR